MVAALQRKFELCYRSNILHMGLCLAAHGMTFGVVECMLGKIELRKDTVSPTLRLLTPLLLELCATSHEHARKMADVQDEVVGLKSAAQAALW
jgi:hypothetical protein